MLLLHLHIFNVSEYIEYLRENAFNAYLYKFYILFCVCNHYKIRIREAQNIQDKSEEVLEIIETLIKDLEFLKSMLEL
jgi:hypothetical protein